MFVTRFAPSPTGELHLGGLRSALVSWLLAKRSGGRFLLRIEDTDQSRLVEGAKERLLRDLRWCGLDPDDGWGSGMEESGGMRDALGALGVVWEEGDGEWGPYVQSRRLGLYQAVAEGLVETGAAYRCFCSPERLEQVRKHQARVGLPPGYDGACRGLGEEAEERRGNGEKYVIRLKVPKGVDGGEVVGVEDYVRGTVEFPLRQLDDCVLLKSDGFPTYHLASVVDDLAMQITHVVRGQEWLSSAPLHSIIYQSVNQLLTSLHSTPHPSPSPLLSILGPSSTPPTFVHLPLLLAEGGGKLSKRRGAMGVGELREKGYLPEAVLNFVALLGWSADDGKDIFYHPQELVEAFTPDRILTSNAVVTVSKLDAINTQHIRNLSSTTLIHEIAAKLSQKNESTQSAGVVEEDLDSQQEPPSQPPPLSSLLPPPPTSSLPSSFVDASLHAEDEGVVEEVVQIQKTRFTSLFDTHLISAILHTPTPPHLLSSLPSQPTESLLSSIQATLEVVQEEEEEMDDSFGKKVFGRLRKEKKKALLPTRWSLTAQTKGGSLAEILQLLGPEVTKKRLENAVKFLQSTELQESERN